MEQEHLPKPSKATEGHEKPSMLEVDRFTTPPDPELICPICRCVLNNPHETRCRHVFCKTCIDTWFKTKKASSSFGRTCPKCRKHIYNSRTRPGLPLLVNMINKLSLHCGNQERGCDVVVTRELLEQHEAKCEFRLVVCENYCCQEKVMQKDQEKHAKSCAFRLEKCDGECELMIPKHVMREHNCVAELKKRLKGWDTAIEISKSIRDRTIVRKPLGYPAASKQEFETVDAVFECYTENIQRMALLLGLAGLDKPTIDKMSQQLKQRELTLGRGSPRSYSSHSSSSSDDEFYNQGVMPIPGIEASPINGTSISNNNTRVEGQGEDLTLPVTNREDGAEENGTEINVDSISDGNAGGEENRVVENGDSSQSASNPGATQHRNRLLDMLLGRNEENQRQNNDVTTNVALPTVGSLESSETGTTVPNEGRGDGEDTETRQASSSNSLPGTSNAVTSEPTATAMEVDGQSEGADSHLSLAGNASDQDGEDVLNQPSTASRSDTDAAQGTDGAAANVSTSPYLDAAHSDAQDPGVEVEDAATPGDKRKCPDTDREKPGKKPRLEQQ